LATQPIPEAEQIFHVPLTEIKLSNTNPRSDIDEQELAELAADIAASRVHEPILVRPLKDGKAKYELVFGERRYRASQRAQKETIPSMVREMTDEEAEEAQIAENLQRANLHPLDDAAVIQRLYNRRFKQSRRRDEAIAYVVGRVHKDASYVARYLKLNDLIATGKAAFRKDQILLGHALELSRLREDEQKSALEWMLNRDKEVQTDQGWTRHRLIPSVQELKLWVQQNLFLDLSRAPFDTADAILNRKMGACTECQFRSGNQPALFGDLKKGDVCTVPPCWAIKRNASILKQAKSLAQELGVDSILKVGIGYASWNSSKIPVDVYIEYHSDARIVKKGDECKNTKAGLVTWIARSGDNTTLKVGDKVHVCTSAQSCPKHKHTDSRAERPRKSYEQMATTRLDNLQKETPQRVRAALIRAVVEAAQKDRRKLASAEKTKFELLASQMHSDLFFDRHRDLCKLMGVEPRTDKNHSKDWRGTSEEIFDGNPIALMVAMALMHRYHAGSYSRSDDPLIPLLQVYRINAAAVEKKTKAGIQQKIDEIKGALGRRKAKLAKASEAPAAPASAKSAAHKK
jgi:ParB family transcriptional regulator, chromosome partitioning protein